MNRQELVEIRFTVPAIPIAQPRQRSSAFILPSGKIRVGNYTPGKHPVQDFKASCRLAATTAYKGAPLEGPIGLWLVFVMPRPGRLIWKRRDMPREWHTSRPDRDNLEKALKDSLSGIIWRDDSQVCAGETRKVIAAGDEQPHVSVTIEQIGSVALTAEAG